MILKTNRVSKPFEGLVNEVIDRCATAGVIMRLCCWERSPTDQARLWRQSRSTEEIMAKVAELYSEGLRYIADCIMFVGPQHGAWATNAIPGYSWHQWGEAVDCFWLLDGKAEWSTRKRGAENGYRVYAGIAEALGLTSLGLKMGKDWGHLQWCSGGVASNFDGAQVCEGMKKRWGDISLGQVVVS